jgi:diadenosine tetraphosphatase ApaH/serine/threonine PP2A family protein phosphatase
MRILVISDIHSNFTALRAVLRAAGSMDAVWCLGDLVGYGPQPNECIAEIQNLPGIICVMGNHDAATAGLLPLETFNSDARRSVEWNQNKIDPDHLKFLQDLPKISIIEKVTLVHGSIRDPIWEYILDRYSAYKSILKLTTPIGLVGHTHYPSIFLLGDGSNAMDIKIAMPSGALLIPDRTILNPGSVGQPRDHDPRAAYAVFDTDTGIWEQHRIAYNISEVIKFIMGNGLPKRNAERLEGGW